MTYREMKSQNISIFFNFGENDGLPHTSDPYGQCQALLTPRLVDTCTWSSAWPAPAHSESSRGCTISILSSISPSLLTWPAAKNSFEHDV